MSVLANMDNFINHKFLLVLLLVFIIVNTSFLRRYAVPLGEHFVFGVDPSGRRLTVLGPLDTEDEGIRILRNFSKHLPRGHSAISKKT